MNNSGIRRSVLEGEHRMPEADTAVTLETKDSRVLSFREGDGTVTRENDGYRVFLPAGGRIFANIG